MPLVDDDLKHLTAAHGYVELGMFWMRMQSWRNGS